MIKFHIDNPAPNGGRITINGVSYEFSYNMKANAVISSLKSKGITLSEENEKEIMKIWN